MTHVVSRQCPRIHIPIRVKPRLKMVRNWNRNSMEPNEVSQCPNFFAAHGGKELLIFLGFRFIFYLHVPNVFHYQQVLNLFPPNS
jgi:hypothetical protein